MSLKKLYFFIGIFISLLLFTEGLSFLLLKTLPSPQNKERDAIYFKKKVPHPYLGYIEPEQSIPKIKLDKESDTFNIGLFGGSVANQICDHEKKFHIIRKFFSNWYKNVKVNCFAVGGGRQPRQAVAYLLYGDHLQEAFFFEGFNELVSIHRHKEFPEYPMSRLSSVWYQGFENFLSERILVYLIYRIHKWSMKESTFFTMKFLKRVGQQLSLDYGAKREANLEELNTQLLSDLNILNEIWLMSLKKIDHLSKQNNKNTTLVIQPMQAINGNTKLSKRLLASIQKVDEMPFQNLKVVNYSHFFKEKEAHHFIDEVHLKESALNLLIKDFLSKFPQQSN